MRSFLCALALTLGPSHVPPDLDRGAVATAVAERIPPPIPAIPEPIAGRCTEYEYALGVLSPGWDVTRMSRIMYRESNCQPDVRSRTRDTGLLQINDINLPFLRDELGEWVDRWTLTDPTQNIRAAAALFVYWQSHGSSGYRPWQ